ncbi:MAG: hypothetical protein ACK4FB_09230 [Brevundimonas sp.]|uniref:hypothetical protein n=1 Tax=Brevundimonas sp. TaxID=1871086 RepID=UPI00391B43E4
MKRLLPSILLAAGFLIAAAGLKYAESVGLVGDDMAQRAVQVMIGLMLAGFANVAPKRIGPQRMSREAEARMQTARRIGGWSLTLAGLAHAGLWAFAPVDFAVTAAMILVGSSLAIAIGYAIWACRNLGAPASEAAKGS